MPDDGRQIGPLVYPPPGRADVALVPGAVAYWDMTVRQVPFFW